MKNFLILTVILLLSINVISQENANLSYNRSSLYPILLSYTYQSYSQDIVDEYLKIPISDKFDDHTLGIKYIKTHSKETDDEHIVKFLENNAVARRMVAKWFGRDLETGKFNIDLMSERGLYNANWLDANTAAMYKRGYAILSDAGEELIANSFVIIHEIRYIDKENTALTVGTIASTIGAVASGFSLVGGGISILSSISNSASTISSISNTIAGFTVRVHSHLYQLEWNDSIANVFYNQYWIDDNSHPDSIIVRKKRFEKCNDLFRLKHIGDYKSRSSKTVLNGLYEDSDVIRKVCARALDNNTANLQQKYEVFKIKTPIISVEGEIVKAPIGLKENISPESKFEVLERYQDNNGLIHYKKVGVVIPIGTIWDNRYMAIEEEAEGADLKATSFKKISGGDFYRGMLLKEIEF